MSLDLNAFGVIRAHASALPPRRKPPKHRHATPSGPWPFLDLSDSVDALELATNVSKEPNINHVGSNSRSHWSQYPRSLFGNWTQMQQEKSGIATLVNRRTPVAEHCRIFQLDISSDGIFHADPAKLGSEEGDYVVKSGKVGSRDAAESRDSFWEALGDKPSPECRVRALFVENLSGPVLQMLGTKFHIEPFFFSSSVNSIPSRYQEQVRPGEGDHITMTLSFIRTLPNPSTMPPSLASFGTTESNDQDALHMLQSSFLTQIPIIDVEAPLVLTSNPSRLLILDLISLHVVRKKFVPDMNDTESPTVDLSQIPNGSAPLSTSQQTNKSSTSLASNLADSVSTIISYHAKSSPSYPTTSASTLHMRLMAAGRSVYWSNIFKSTVPSGDPTFVTLSLLWYPLYAWDEVLDALLGEVAFLEAHTLSAIPSASPEEEQDAHDQTHVLTHQLHVVRAHLLHYESLLDDFRKTVDFVYKTKNPGLDESYRPITPSTQSPIRTATPSHYPDSLRPVLPDSAGEAPSLAAAARDTLDQANEEENNERAQAQSRFAPPRMFSEPTVAESYHRLLDKECTTLLNEIARLEMTRAMLNKRLGNVMELAFSSVNIEDSRRMKNLAEVSVRDSAVMKQIAYLTMIFLPASFVAAVFGMNVTEINQGSNETLAHYAAAAIPLTVITVWVMMMQYHSTKKHHQSKLTPGSTMFLFARVAPASLWRRFWNTMWRPLQAIWNGLFPWWNPARNVKNRSQSRNRSHTMSWIPPSTGTSLRRTPAHEPPDRPISDVLMENGNELLPVHLPSENQSV